MKSAVIPMTLKDAIEGQEYIIKDLVTDDEELEDFLFSLGCYSGEAITVVSASDRESRVLSLSLPERP